MSFKYKGKKLSSIGLFGELIKDYGTFPDCGNDSVGGTPSVGSMNYDGEHGTLERTCKCGWEIKVGCKKI